MSATFSRQSMMRIAPAIVVLAAVATVACASRSVYPNDTDMRTETRLVLAAEDAYVAAEVNRDELALRRLVDDKFVFNAADGSTSGKEELIRSLLRMNMTGQLISERSVILEADMAVIFGTTELQFTDPGQPPRSSRLRYTSVYVKRGGSWQMLALQMQPRSTR
jgi:ketosteroid isomerase-like protein